MRFIDLWDGTDLTTSYSILNLLKSRSDDVARLFIFDISTSYFNGNEFSRIATVRAIAGSITNKDCRKGCFY